MKRRKTLIEKDKLLNKLVKKDYNNLLEELLATKEYGEDVKSLILSMCYKIETAYKDYEKVKINVLSKEEYMKNIFMSIKDNCDQINFLENTKKKAALYTDCKIDREQRIIECYPIEKNLLYCLSKIDKKDNILKSNNFIVKEAVTKLLNEGNSINVCEPLRDFNGFSWNVLVKDIENLNYNLIYQDLILICGNDFLEEWINNNKFVIDYLDSFKRDVAEKYGEKLSEEIVISIIRIAIIQEALSNEEFKENAENEKQRIEAELVKFQDSTKYIVELGNEKKQLNKKIKKIDQIINDKDLLYLEYERRNEQLPLEEKIFSMKVLKKILQDERKQILKRTEECNHLMNPHVFLKRFDSIKQDLLFLKVFDVKDIKKEQEKCIIKLQKSLLDIFKLKLKKANEKQQIIDLIYQLRYYMQIPVSETKRVCQIEELKKYIDEIESLLIKKAIDKKVITEISENSNINMEIIKNIFNSKIISLNAIQISICKEDDEWQAHIFDEDILESKIEINDINKKDLKIKIRKKVKFFY